MSYKYDVYGLGNALVDYEYKVSDADLKALKVDKGLMTLVEENRQTEILNHLQQSTPERACGGSAANTMIGVAQLGGKAFYSCKVARDESGDFYARDLLANGVQSSLQHKNRETGVTGKCLVLISEDAERSMNTFLGITGSFSENEIVSEELVQAKYLYLEGYLVASPTGKEACIKAYKMAKEHGVKTALTFSDPNMVEFFYDGMKEMMGDGVDLLFCNEAEALKFTKSDDINVAIKELKKYAKTLTITLGAKGSYVFDGNTEKIVEGFKVNAIDTNGAGDIYAGSFLYGITNGLDYFKAARLANYSASLLVTKFGPRLDHSLVGDLRNFLKELM